MTTTQRQNGTTAARRAAIALHRLPSPPIPFHRLWAVAMRTLGDGDDAADALQDAMISAFRRAGSFRGDSAVTTWLHRIAANCALMYIREQRSRIAETSLQGFQETEEGRRWAESKIKALTGGDPMALSARRLGDIVRRIDAIPHVEVIRIHTRVPVVDPARVTPALVRALGATKPVYVAIHCNHADELTQAARAACARLADAGHPLLAQTVLLKGVNDSPETLEALMRALVRNRIKPYYLHHADLAPGTSHFRTTLAEGQALAAALRARASGLCQPTYVLDIPGGFGKVPVGPCYAEGGTVTDTAGRTHAYP